MPIPTPTAPERFATILRCLTQAVVTRNHFGLALPLIGLIVDRIREIKQCFARLATRIHEGKYVPRRSAPRRPPADPKPRPREPNKLPRKFGWLLPLVPAAVGYRSQLEYLLRDPEFAALLAAAPTSLGRPLRSLCWMLLIPPPPILAPPKRPRPPRKEPRPPRKPRPAPLPPPGPPPPHPDAPWWLRMPPSRTRWLPARKGAPKNRV